MNQLENIENWLKIGKDEAEDLIDLPWKVTLQEDGWLMAEHPKVPFTLFIGMDEEYIHFFVFSGIETALLEPTDRLSIYRQLLFLNNDVNLMKFVIEGTDEEIALKTDLDIKNITKEEIDDALMALLTGLYIMIQALDMEKEFNEEIKNRTYLVVKEKIAKGAKEQDLIEFLNKKMGISKKEAKKINDTLAPSCLMFHNVQSSFYTSYCDFVKNELEFSDISFKFGPYYTNKNFGSNIEDFINIVNCFCVDNSPKSRLRKWLGELHYDTNYASSLLKRINQVTDKDSKTATNNALKELHKDLSLDNLFISKNDKDYTPIYDIITIASITGDKKCKFI